MASQSPEAKELDLVGKVELRIALADTDAKLETLLKTYLAPLLLKLASEHVSVRNKVIAVCQHVNTRIKGQDIQLPVAALLKQFKDHPDTPLIRHFDLLYVQQGITRQPLKERLELLPVLINGLARDTAKSALHGSQLFNLLLRLLTHFQLPPRGSKDDNELRSKLEITDEDAKFLAHWFGKLILFAVVRPAPLGPSSNVACSGLSPDEYQFLTLHGKPGVWDPAAESGLNLSEAKVTVAKFLASGLFNDDERFFPAVFASADSNSRISDIGDDILKRTLPNTDLENAVVISKLYDVYFGTPDGPLPARPALQTKILSYLAKSVLATTFTSHVLRLVEEGLTYGTTTEGTVNARGREAVKLRSAIFTFVNFMARNGASSDLRVVAATLVRRLRAFIEDQGWPRVNPDEDIALRGYGYEVIGLLARAAPEDVLIEPELSLLKWLFKSLGEDTSGRDTAFSIDEALSSALGALTVRLSADVQHNLRDLLLQQMTKEESSTTTTGPRRSTRYAAVRFANRCLPYDDVVARWIDILAVSGPSSENQEVREEGHRGLDPHWSRLLHSSQAKVGDDSDQAFPDFTELVVYLFSLPDGFHTTTDKWRPDIQVQRFKEHFSFAFEATAKFCRQLLMAEALRAQHIPMAVDIDWARKLDTAVAADRDARHAVTTYLNRAATEQGFILQSVLALIRALYEGLLWNEGSGLGNCGEWFVELCSLSSESLLDMSRTAPAFRSLKPSIYSNKEQTRLVAAHAYGLLATHSAVFASEAEQSLQNMLQKASLWKEAVGSQLNEASGAILAIAYYFSRLAARRRRASALEATLEALLRIVFDVLKNTTDKTLKEASHLAISQLSLFFVIKPESIAPYMQYNAVVDKLMEDAKTGNEKAILALGHFAMIPDEKDDESSLNYVEDKIFELHEVRQAEAQFSIGEAVSCLAAGWQATILAPKMDIDAPTPSGPPRTNTLARVLGRVLENSRNTKPSLKKASVIWLLSLVQFCGQLSEVRSRLPQCQIAFKNCLSARDEVVQEAASRGLGLVYEKGDRQLKDDLVRDLVGSFSDNKANLSGNVTNETQLFEEGALPTGEGSVTTYKDILSLASEVGDSSLVYRFMSLAANNAIWSSRAAFGRFGLSNVLSDSAVDGYLAENPKLYPKLYRYRFDPNTNVQRSMNDIWNALVKDSSSTIDKHFDAIMEDLLVNIINREWRVRQASCAAIGDLVQGRTVDKYEKYLGRIWNLCFKVLDDIKETVRQAAAGLARVLTGILTRSLEAGDTSQKNAEAMLKHVLPFLLSSSGLESSAEEVQRFALATLLQIIKKSSAKILRPFIPELVERLLLLLSSIEPQAINYYHLNASKYNLTEQKIDDARLAIVRGSPLMEAIERCLDLVDDSTMNELSPHLESAMKSAVGLPSKTGVSRVLVSMSTRRSFVFKPYADQFLKLIEKHIYDRNETVSTSYAAAAGYVSRQASDKQVLALIAFSKKLYFTSEEDRNRVHSGDIVHAISKSASDRFNAFSAELLPFIYVAKHDSESQVKELFAKTWDDNVGGSRAVQLYVKDIVAIATEHLDSPRWTLKHTAARSIAEAANALASSIEDISLANAETIWPALDKALGGKSWEGKEVVLQAFAKFVERGGQLWRTKKDVADQIKKVIVREAKRQNKTYRQHALKPLGQVAAARTDLDMSETVFDIVEPIVDEATTSDEDAMDVDAGEDVRKNEKLRDNTVTGAIFSLQSVINPMVLQDKALSSATLRALQLIAKLNTLHASAIHVATFEGLQSLFERLLSKGQGFASGSEKAMKGVLMSLFFDDRYEGLSEAMRFKRGQALVALAKTKDKAFVKEVIGERLEKEKQTEKSPVVKQEVEKALTALAEGQ